MLEARLWYWSLTWWAPWMVPSLVEPLMDHHLLISTHQGDLGALPWCLVSSPSVQSLQLSSTMLSLHATSIKPTLSFNLLSLQCGTLHLQGWGSLHVSLLAGLLFLLFLTTLPPCGPLCLTVSHLPPWVLSLLSSPSLRHHTASHQKNTDPRLKTPFEPD